MARLFRTAWTDGGTFLRTATRDRQCACRCTRLKRPFSRWRAFETVVSCPEIHAQAPQITDLGRESIAKTEIRVLCIARAAITDAGLQHSEKMTTLRSLTLSDTQAPIEGIESREEAFTRHAHYGTAIAPISAEAWAAVRCPRTTNNCLSRLRGRKVVPRFLDEHLDFFRERQNRIALCQDRFHPLAHQR